MGGVSLYISLMLISCSQLYLEVLLTRFFSISQGYHWAFLVVGLALLGGGIGGTFLVFVRNLSKRGINLLRILIALFPLSIIFAYFETNLIPFDPYLMPWSKVQLLFLFLNFIFLLLPFLFAGLSISLSLSVFSEIIPKLYSATFIGASLGSILVLVVLPYTDEFGALLIGVIVGLIGSLILNRDNSILKNTSLLLSILGFLILIFRPIDFPLRLSPYKDLIQLLRYPKSKIIATYRNSSSRVDIVKSPTIRYAPGLSYKYKKKVPVQLGITIDGENLKGIARSNSFTEYLPQAVLYKLSHKPKVLILESGGGLDISLVLKKKVKDISVVLENPILAEILKKYFPKTRFIVESPRVYLKQNKETFDLIQFSLQESFYVVTSGAYSLGENYLYTVESFRDAYIHLSSDGFLSFTSWLQRPPTEELRLLSIIIKGLEESGVKDVNKHLLAFRSFNIMTFIVKKSEILPREISIVKNFTDSMAFDLVYTPYLKVSEINRFNVLPEEIYFKSFQKLIMERDDFIKSYPFQIDPSRDDRPFFFHFFKLEQIPFIMKNWGHTWQPFGGAGYLILLVMPVFVIIISFFLIILPLMLKRIVFLRDYRTLKFCLYFFLIGLAYLFMELPLMQKLILYLGKPTYSFSLTLAVLLFFSGLGSMNSLKLARYSSLIFFILGVGLISLPSIIEFIFKTTLGFNFPIRILISTLIIGSFGFLMGIPFPSGLEKVRNYSSTMIPWVWAVNGFASVLSSFLSILLALSFGFSIIIIIAGLLYLVSGFILDSI